MAYKLLPAKKGRLTKARQEEVYNFMAELHEEGKLGKYTLIQLGEMLKINKETAMRYRKKVYKKVCPVDLDRIRSENYAMYERMRRNLSRILDLAEESSDMKTQVILMDRWEKNVASFTKFLEDYDIKPKMADKVEVDTNITKTNININYEAQSIFLDNLDKRLQNLEGKEKQKVIVDIMEEKSLQNEANN